MTDIPSERFDPAARHVGILVFDEVEVLDFCGPFEVFSSAAAPAAPGEPEPHLFRVSIVAERPGPVRCRGGLVVVPHHALDDHPRFDLIVVPGGYGTRREQENPVGPSRCRFKLLRSQRGKVRTCLCERPA